MANELRKLTLAVKVISEKHQGPLALTSGLTKFFQEFRPDIVHTHKYKDSILGSIVARYLGVPLLVRSVLVMPEPFRGRKS